MRVRRPLLLLISTALPAWALRAAALVTSEAQPSGLDLRGFASDLGIALLLVVLLRQALRWGRWPGRIVAGLLLAAWLTLLLGNFEHLLANDANLDPSGLKYLGDTTFQGGSMLHVSAPWLSLGALLGALGAFIAACRAPRSPARWGLATATLLLLGQIWPMAAGPRWQQESFLAAAPRLFEGASVGVVEAPNTALSTGAPRSLRVDLDGAPRFPFAPRDAEQRPNVLLLIIEGVSGGHVPKIAEAHGVELPDRMPRLSAWGQKGLTAATFIGHQRQTDRGEYALLCGDLPKLSRETPRMTDVAQMGAARQCLPEYLRQRGYQTLYLQPAPMSFMMKDQFMGKIGFEESLGGDRFVEGYHKGGWGIDDRAFFEQSFDEMRRLDAQGTPWFVTMMTVGTHHPLIVPEAFRIQGKESDFGRAVRYTDIYLDALLRQMERAGMLEDTVIVITSDESRGFKHGYGGVTRTLSQSWGFLVALTPTQAPAFVEAPYGQSDLALSLVDYLGLDPAGSGFYGRSLFREYAAPRPMAFANIFKRKAYYLSEAGVLTSCTEQLDSCNAYHRKGGDRAFFGPGWEKRALHAPDVEQLAAHIRWSARPQGDTRRPSVSHLIAQDRGIVELTSKPGHGMFLFGGQFLYAPAGKLLEVEMDLELDGPGAVVRLSGKLSVEYKNRYKLPRIPELVDGDRLRLRYTYTQEGPLKRIDTVMFSKRLNDAPARLIAHRARVRILDIPPGMDEAAGAKLHALRLSRRAPDGGWRDYEGAPELGAYSVFEDPRFERAPCVERTWSGRLLARRCGRGDAISGPYAAAPKGTLAEARFLVRGLEGSGQVRAELLALVGKRALRRGGWRTLRAGQEMTLSVKRSLRQPRKLIEARLGVRAASSSFEFEILEGGLELSEPQPEPTLAPDVTPTPISSPVESPAPTSAS